jgi:hypothetical protein
MDDKHDPNGSVPIGTFKATSDDGELEIPIEIVVDDEIEERQLALQSRDDTDTGSVRARGDTSGPLFEQPRRQRVATLLGVPLPGSAVAGSMRGTGSDPVKATNREISAAVDDALDERPTTIYGYKRESLADLESLVEAEMTELPSSESTGEIVGVVGRSSDTGTFEIEVHEVPDSRKSMPVLAPAQFVEARARDATSDQAKADARARDLADRARDGQPTAAIASRSGGRDQRDHSKTNDARRDRVDSEAPTPKPISSLAPVEVKRTRQREPAKRREPASAIGYALVAAMVLLGIGGWFLTAGGYRRGSDQAAQPTAAASVARPSEPLGSPKLAVMPTAPAPVAEPAPPVEEATPTPTPGPAEPGNARPRVAGKAVRKSVAAPAPVAESNAIETPSRDDLLTGLDRVRSNVRACAEGRNGVAEVDLTIAANGVVTNALVGGDFGGTPQGSCIARAVRKARFPTFKQDRYRVLFPYVL